MDEIKQIINLKAQAQPTPMEFELAYQARVAMDRIRFAIKHTEQFAPHTDQMEEARLQLLDALDRLASAERRFQQRFGARDVLSSGPRIELAGNGSQITARQR